ncbi:MAG TPA: hypothetical protein VMK65_12795 [Longimicrobiales bacterium]|nr:hypothetical protein [Longimicrobiales bacterium]
MSKTTLLSVSALLLTLAQAASGQAPRTEAQVPLFPGAQQTEREGVEGVSHGISEEGEAILDGARTVYEVRAQPEDVLRWYLERLGATAGHPDGAPWIMNEEWPAAGSGTPVFFWLEPHDIHRAGDAMVMSGAQIREMLEEAGRKPFRPGEWVNYADLQWAFITSGGERGQFFLNLSDQGLHSGEHLTGIELQWRTSLHGDQAYDHLEKAHDEEMEETHGQRMAEMGAAGPSDAELGVAPYPGATFDVQSSAGMSLGDEERYYIYLSADPIEKVVAFYEAKTGKKAEKTDETSYGLALEGSLPFPAFGIYFQTGLPYPPPTKTVITVRRAQ